MKKLAAALILLFGFSSVSAGVESEFVMEGDSVTLDRDVTTNPEEMIKWFFNDIHIAEITVNQSQICADDQCKERFRDRLKVDPQTGSLTITNISTENSGSYHLRVIISERISGVKIFNIYVLAFSGVETVTVKEGESVTLNTGIKTYQLEKIQWHYNGFEIAEITGDLSYICTDVQCNDGDERFRDRLQLDYQTGSLTVMNITTEDSGLYDLHVTNKRGSISKKVFIVGVYGFLGVGFDGLTAFVMEEDSVILKTDVETNQEIFIKWFFDGDRIAVITRDQSHICTEDDCKERFRDRLKVDHQTGSLTITNSTTKNTGVYRLEIFNKSDINFGVTVHSKQDEIKRKSVNVGESVTLETNLTKKKNNPVTWFFNDAHIAEITDQTQICKVDQCKQRFRDRLTVDNQTGSLTITDTRITDTGEYKLNISSHRIIIIRNYSVSVIAVGVGIYAAVGAAIVLVAAAAAALTYLHRSRQAHIRKQHNDQINNVQDPFSKLNDSVDDSCQSSTRD